ncbi:MAG: hypothetical protein HYS27_08710 [Deltaproteobacteria bacterium]|nr:hypothetical protein [Deltaproteobacteria bacterium]
MSAPAATPARVVLRGARLDLHDGLLLGEGGEARVYRHPTDAALALKVFWQPAKSAAKAERAAAMRLSSLRADKLRAFPRDLPALVAALVVAPQAQLLDGSGEPCGYTMRRVDGAQAVATLCTPRRALDNGSITTAIKAIAAALPELHARAVVVGDLNDGNVLLDAAGAPHLIDADSFQLGALPCPVAHERFLDPRLYGRAFADAPCFDAGSDGYALRVQLFTLLTLVHPYGGTHPSLPTLLRRAEAGHSVLRGDVTLPKCARPFAALPDDLLHDLEACFEKGARSPLVPALLDVRWRRCGCGLEHARTTCPACRVRVPAPAIRTSKGVVAETIWAGAGTVLAARDHDGQLAYLVDDGGRVLREDSTMVWRGARPAGLRFLLAGDATWVARALDEGGAELVKIRGGVELERAHAATAFGAPVAAAGRGGLFVAHGDVLTHHERGTRVGRVLLGRTLLFSSDDGGLGAYRVGQALFAFRFDARGVRDVTLPAGLVAGTLVDLAVSFGADGKLLLGVAVDDNGARRHALALVDKDGHTLAHASGAPDAAPMFGTIRGFALAHGRVLAPTRQGVMVLDVDGGRLVEGASFPDTREWVDETTELLPGPGGSLVVVQPQALVKIRLAGS